MRLTVLPNSLWIAYTLTRPEQVQRRLPPETRLVSLPLLADESVSTPKLLFNVYDVSSNWMHGTRLEVVTLVQREREGTVHFCVLDCFTNTLQWDPERGIRLGNAKITRPSPGGDQYTLQIRSRYEHLLLRARHGLVRPVHARFAVDANRVCYFGNSSRPFAMAFDDLQILQPVRDLVATELVNTYWADVRESDPSHLFLHPHAMDFWVDVDEFLTNTG
jgi:hypothetical protein